MKVKDDQKQVGSDKDNKLEEHYIGVRVQSHFGPLGLFCFL